MGKAAAIDEITSGIERLGLEIKEAKTAKLPKDQWNPKLMEMLALKVTYKEMTGKDFGGAAAPVEKKVKQDPSKLEAKDPVKAAKKAAEKAAKVSERRNRALMKTSILGLNLAK